VAKIRMMCPFSNRLCEECILYRGRHYYMCFCQKYRGYIGDPDELAREKPSFVARAGSNGAFEMPSVIRTRAIDPFVVEHESDKEEV
jgi:hypothetical protein